MCIRDSNGSVLEKTVNPSEKLQGAQVDKREMQYLYVDGDLYYFMDNETYDQIPLPMKGHIAGFYAG